MQRLVIKVFGKQSAPPHDQSFAHCPSIHSLPSPTIRPASSSHPAPSAVVVPRRSSSPSIPSRSHHVLPTPLQCPPHARPPFPSRDCWFELPDKAVPPSPRPQWILPTFLPVEGKVDNHFCWGCVLEEQWRLAAFTTPQESCHLWRRQPVIR